MGGGGRHLAAGAAGGLADKILRAFDRSRGDPGPDRRPAEMRDRRHGLRMNLVVGLRKNLFGGAFELQFETGAASSAHAERLPCETGLQRVIVLGNGQQHLVGAGGVIGAAGDGDDAVGLRAIGNHRGVAHQRDLGIRALDGGGGEADVAAVLSLGGRGGQEHLFGRDAAHQCFVPPGAGAVPDQAGDLGLMHRKDHRRRRAGAAERVAHVGDIGDRCAVAAERQRDLDAQQPLRAHRVERFLREPRIAVDRFGFRGGGRRNRSRSLREGTAVGNELFVRLFRNGVA